MPGYTLRQLEYFVAVADAGSISAAAAKLHVTSTAVASAMNELERILRSQLLVRRKAHGATLTPTGTYFYQRASTLLREADELELATGSRGSELVGPLVLGCYSTLAPTIIPPIMEWMARQHPKVDLSVVTGSQAELEHLLLSGTVDLAIGYDIALPNGIGSVRLYEAPAYVLLPRSHSRATETSIALADLATEPMILLELPPAEQHTLSLFAGAGVTPTIAQRTADFELTRSLVARGFGYTILIQRPALSASYEGLPLALVEISPDVTATAVGMMWLHDVRLTDRAAALVEFAERSAAELDPRSRHGERAI